MYFRSVSGQSQGSPQGVACQGEAKSAGSSPLSSAPVMTIATQTGVEDGPQRFDVSKLSIDPHCYECKVKYRDPRPKDLVMFLHAYTYSVRILLSKHFDSLFAFLKFCNTLFQGPDWVFETELPEWAKEDWIDPEDYLTDD